MFKYEGTISHGTLLPNDLIEAFLPVLADLHPDKDTINAIEKEYEKLQQECDDTSTSYLLNDVVFPMMDEVAPKGYYFGSLEGDGSDFGFWKNDPTYTEFFFTVANEYGWVQRFSVMLPNVERYADVSDFIRIAAEQYAHRKLTT